MIDLIVFPADEFKTGAVNEFFANEFNNVSGSFATALVRDDLSVIGPVRSRSWKAVYRGWMLNATEYAIMAQNLREKNIFLQTGLPDYLKAHQLPGWYDIFKEFTPESIWFSRNEVEEFLSGNAIPKSSSFIVKDYVKSRKHEWDTACYASSIERLPSVINEFIRLQDADNAPFDGIVVRAFEKYRKNLGEARIWWVNGEPALISSHPDTPNLLPPVPYSFVNKVSLTVQELDCYFITTDVALTEDGIWRIIEVGDGQVSGLPSNISSWQLDELFDHLYHS